MRFSFAAGLSPRRRLLVFALAAVLVLAGGAAAIALRPDRTAPPPRSSADVAVVIVPGYDGTPASVAELAARIRSAGRTVLVADLPDRGRGEIVASAGVLDLLIRTQAGDLVDLVGYSAGGVVVRAWLEALHGAARARHVVLLGTPNHGADVAALALSVDPGQCAGACADLAPGSALLDRLNAPDETPAGPDYTSVWTDRDATVTPPDTAVLAGAVNLRVQSVCPSDGVGHGGLTHDPVVFGLVLRALDGSLPRPPGPGDCAGMQALGAGRPPA